MKLEDRKKYFLKVFKKVEKKYGKSEYRLAGESWGPAWKTLIVTIMSAQSRDETTIPIGESLFKKYGTLGKLGNASHNDILKVLKSMNYNKTKTRHVIGAAKFIMEEFNGVVPDTIDELVRIPGVGRKTANLVMSEVHKKDEGICVDTHVHRISNVFGFVDSKTPEKTERELMEVVPKRLWGKVNRMFVLWGKDVPGRDRERFLEGLKE
jgi:endonuclease III